MDGRALASDVEVLKLHVPVGSLGPCGSSACLSFGSLQEHYLSIAPPFWSPFRSIQRTGRGRTRGTTLSNGAARKAQ